MYSIETYLQRVSDSAGGGLFTERDRERLTTALNELAHLLEEINGNVDSCLTNDFRVSAANDIYQEQLLKNLVRLMIEIDTIAGMYDKVFEAYRDYTRR